MKLGRQQMVEFKKSLKPYHIISLKVLNKSWHKFCSFCMDGEAQLSEQEEEQMFFTSERERKVLACQDRVCRVYL
jgi:hypothetical protein